MKPYYLCLLCMTLFVSCSDNNEIINPLIDSKTIGVLDYDDTAANYANPYDYAGKIHQELLFTYYNNTSLPFTLTGIITTAIAVANTNDSFLSLVKNVPYSFSYSDRVADIVSQPSGFQDDIINASILDSNARESFKTFITDLFIACEEEDDYQVLYDTIVAYEAGIYNNTLLSVEDKSTICMSSN